MQSWPQEKCSPLEFGIARRKTCWDSRLGKELKCDHKRRWADIYVFCALECCHIRKHGQALDTDNWRFYVVCTGALNEVFGKQKKVRLGPLKDRLGERLKKCRYATLAETIHEIARTACRPVGP